jgi:copper chaperone CopZ
MATTEPLYPEPSAPAFDKAIQQEPEPHWMPQSALDPPQHYQTPLPQQPLQHFQQPPPQHYHQPSYGAHQFFAQLTAPQPMIAPQPVYVQPVYQQPPVHHPMMIQQPIVQHAPVIVNTTPQPTFVTSSTAEVRDSHNRTQSQAKKGVFANITTVLKTVKGAGKIEVKLDRESYLAGQIITGHVELNVTENIVAKRLMIKWEGFERSKVDRNQADQRNNQSTMLAFESREFFKQESPLSNYNGETVAPGKYTYGFQFQLPQGLPGVFSAKGKGYKAAIIYRVKVWVDMKGINIKNSKFITINENLTRLPQLVQVKKEKSFFMNGNGKLQVHLDVTKDILAPGEKALIRAQIQNDSKKDVYTIRVKLMQDMTLTSSGRTATIHKEVCRQVFDGVPSRTTTTRDLYIDVPSTVFPTANGKFVINQYHFEVECAVTMAKDLRVETSKVSIAMPNGVNQGYNVYADYNNGWWK